VSELTTEEKSKLMEISREVAGSRKLVAVVAYGSRVAGYARQDSDYDILVIVDKLRPRAKYVYGEGKGLYYSALLVEDRAFQRDCSNADLGEFVCGRLLNRYEVLEGAEYILRHEGVMKRRVILEGLQESIERLGPMAFHVIFSSRYFLFNKLKKRASLYPPVAYSYVKTYSDSLRERNVKASTVAFQRELEALCSEGLLLRLNNGYMLSKSAEKKLKAPPLSSSIRLARVGVKQYVTHGLAGRVGVDVAFKELFSKIGRAREREKVPEELSDPRVSLSIPEGILIFGGNWLEATLRSLGVLEPYSHRSEPMGDFFSTATLHTIHHGGKVTRFVSKRYQDIWSLKWMLASVVALSARTFESRPMYRLANEYMGLMHLREIGVRTPRVFAIVPDEKVIVREHVAGQSLEEMVKSERMRIQEVLECAERFGDALGRLHQSGISMGDTKPTNLLYQGGDITVIDLEQAEEEGDYPWDVAEFLYYTATLVGFDVLEKIAERFIEAYLRNGNSRTLREAAGQKYTMPFQLLVQPNVLVSIKDRLSQAGR
jgi:Kae1-associated kinase Bud32